MQQFAFVNYNGAFMAGKDCLVSPDSRGFKFGDGFFETMKLVNGKIVLASFHFERLFASLALLRFEPPPFFTPAYLNDLVTELAQKNGHEQLARIRITIFRGNGGLYDPEDHLPHCLIQTWPLQPAVWNEEGLAIEIFRDACKAADTYAAVKSNNYLGYAMAALWAKERGLHDALLLNAAGRIADATIANVFVVHDGVVITPPVAEGGVNGVMRRHLLGAMRSEGWAVAEIPLTEGVLLASSECFLTNVISGIRWVKTLGNNTFRCNLSALLYNSMISAQLW